MPQHKRIDIQESNILIIFSYDVTWNFAFNNFCEYACHYNSNQTEIFTTSNSISPAGVLIFAISPFFFPSNPFPMGDMVDIFPAFRSASSSDTEVYVTD